MTSLNLNFSATQCALVGDLTRDTIAKINNKQFNQFFSNDSAVIDLAEVSKVDSAGLAWLLSMIEQSKKSACVLTYVHLSQGLLQLAKLSAVDTFLPIDG